MQYRKDGLMQVRRRASHREIAEARAALQIDSDETLRGQSRNTSRLTAFPPWAASALVVVATWLGIAGLLSIFSLSIYGIELNQRDANMVVLTARSLVFTAAPTVAFLVGVLFSLVRLHRGDALFSLFSGLLAAFLCILYVGRDLSGQDRVPDPRSAAAARPVGPAAPSTGGIGGGLQK